LQNNVSWRVWLATASTALALIACGGGGGGGEPADNAGTGAGTPAAVVILDSFGLAVASGGADGIGPGDSGGDGTAGEGAPIVGGRVQVTDSAGKTATATTDAQGYYRVKLTGFAPPLVAQVTKADGKVLHSLSVASLKVNAFVTVNLTGLTDKVASDVAVAAGKSGARDLTPQILAANTAAVAQAVNNLRSSLSSVITAAGLTVATFDPIGAPFRPDHTGYDRVLESVTVVVQADGSTQVTVTPTVASYAGHYTGTYGGSDSGTFDVVIASNGSLSGSAFSNEFSQSFSTSGQVSASGVVTFGTVSAPGQASASFQGTISPSGGISGTWSSPEDSGTFTGQRR
jgi:hypothetical protein